MKNKSIVHSHEEAWPAVLEAKLRAVHPERKIEVVNAGVPGYTSVEQRINFFKAVKDRDIFADARIVNLGKTLAYCAQRGGDYDIYTIPATDGVETRLTTAAGLDDGPDYSSDGKSIYFNSERSGTMQIWRMNTDGTDQAQVTTDEFNNWFPHPSPDGRWIAFLSYDAQVQGHPENQDVALRLIPVDGGPIKILAKLYGGQGTINVPSWSPDSQQIAFVSYQPVYK